MDYDEQPLLGSVPILATAKRYILSCLPCGKTTIGSHYVRIGPKIAEGGFSSVFQCTDMDTGVQYALKKMTAVEKDTITSIHNEIRVHQQFQHPNLLELLDCEETETDKGTEFSLLFPLFERGTIGDVIARMRNVGKIFSESNALHLFRQVVDGVGAMHAKGLAHHDIKPANILLSESNDAILMDFGSASKATCDTNDRKAANDLKEWAAEHCTMPYRAPELFEPRNYAHVTSTSDVWSLGCTLFAMAYGFSPFEAQLDASGSSLQYVECSYLRVINAPPFPTPAKYSKSFVKLIRMMIRQNPAERPDVRQIAEVIDGMMTADSAAEQFDMKRAVVE